MALASPLLDQFARAEPLLEPYGPAREGYPPIMVVQTFGPIEAEYASIRKPAGTGGGGGAGLMDLPQRATLVVTGADRVAFLNRMLTQELKGVEPYRAVSSFWLSRKGRVDADLRVIVLPDRVLLDVDAYAAPGAAKTLGAYVISDDVVITDETPARHRLALHGAGAMGAIAGVSTPMAGVGIAAMAPGDIAVVSIGGHEVLVDRCDSAGAPGLELHMPVAAAVDVYNALIAPRAGAEANAAHHGAVHGGVRPIGWAAWNIARIEAGTPVYYLDFGPESLPAETGVLDQRVSFKKGCYLGQEIVARMHSLGHPKQTLCALVVNVPVGFEGDRIAADDPLAEAPDREPPPQPVTGAKVWAMPEGGAAPADASALGEPIGAITSSTISPMRGNRAVCFAQVKWGRHVAGTRLCVDVGGAILGAAVQPSLKLV